MELTDRCERFLKESNRLTADHRKALYVARMEAARSAWSADAGYAGQLVRKASENGRWWTSRSPALPPHFQLALRLVGFDPAQRLARFWRNLSSTRQQKSSIRSHSTPVLLVNRVKLIEDPEEQSASAECRRLHEADTKAFSD
jgi:hypothetical protein